MLKLDAKASRAKQRLGVGERGTVEGGDYINQSAGSTSVRLRNRAVDKR
jgi:hypothetical protein